MNSQDTEAFACRLMREVWETFDVNAVSRFYHPGVVGHHRAQTLDFNDVVNRLKWDHKHSADPIFDVQNIIAATDRFAIRFRYTATQISTGQPFHAEVIYFYHLREGKIAEFWLLADQDFDYREPA